MCGVPGRAENGTQVSLYSAAVYNPGQKSEYRYFHFFLFLLTNVVVYQSVGHRTQLPARFGFAGRFSTDLPE